ncbi:MAG: hypothetical protein ABIA37_01050 [Candidatus Woesearchaeota archaeon]
MDHTKQNTGIDSQIASCFPQLERKGKLWTIIHEDDGLQLAKLNEGADGEGYYFEIWKENEVMGSGDFDVGAKAYWVDNKKGKGQKALYPKQEVLRYFRQG